MSANEEWAGSAFASTAEQRLEAARRNGNLPAIVAGLREVHGPIAGITELAAVRDRPVTVSVAPAEVPDVSAREQRIAALRLLPKAERDAMIVDASAEAFDELMVAEHGESPFDAGEAA